jgi:hypothetical protein
VQTLNFENISDEDALAIADALLGAGKPRMAIQLLRGLAGPVPPGLKVKALVRLGLAQSPSRPRSAAMRTALRELEAVAANVFVGEGLATWHKSLPFFDDPRFSALADKHAGLLPMPNWHWNLQTVVWAIRQAREIEGDFVELGVFRGHTTLFCAEYLDFAAWPKRWFLYDTFDGIPDEQLDPGWAQSNNIYKGTFSFEEVRDRFAHIENISVIKGRVPEILAETSPERIAFMHIDLNNATAEIQALEALYDRLSSGGVIVFDDFGWAVSRAQHDAETAWFAELGLHILSLPTGQGLLVKP